MYVLFDTDTNFASAVTFDFQFGAVVFVVVNPRT